MNLWLRSQDNLTMILVNKSIQIIDYRGLKEQLEDSPLSFLKDMEQVKSYIEKDGWGLRVDEVCLGIYESKDRALEVLDDIQNKLLDNVIATNDDGYATLLENTCVYEMPKE